jgi:hypothetical protein
MGERQGVKEQLREARQRERRLLEQMDLDQQRRNVIPEPEAPRPKVEEGGRDSGGPRPLAVAQGPLVGSRLGSNKASSRTGHPRAAYTALSFLGVGGSGMPRVRSETA